MENTKQWCVVRGKGVEIEFLCSLDESDCFGSVADFALGVRPLPLSEREADLAVSWLLVNNHSLTWRSIKIADLVADMTLLV